MPTPRTPAPSRIGKTLGAILSTSRRGAADPDVNDVNDVNDVVDETAGTPERRGRESTLPEAAVRPAALETAPADPLRVATADQRADAPAVDARAATGDPPATAVIATPTAVARPVVAHEYPQERDDGGARRKKRETFLIPEDLADAMRNAIVHLSGPPLYYTLAEFGEHAIRNYIAQLERDHNAGQPFPARPRGVRQGRPLR